MDKLMNLLRVTDVKTASQILYPDSKNPHSDVVKTQKKLNLLVLEGKLIRGTGWYAVPEYRGEFKEHDRAITEATAKLVRLNLPLSVRREVSFPSVGLRSDLIVLVGRNGKGTCAIIEVALSESKEYLDMKINTWKGWDGATQALSELFGCHIPYFSIVVYRPDQEEFNKFIGGLK